MVKCRHFSQIVIRTHLKVISFSSRNFFWSDSIFYLPWYRVRKIKYKWKILFKYLFFCITLFSIKTGCHKVDQGWPLSFVAMKSYLHKLYFFFQNFRNIQIPSHFCFSSGTLNHFDLLVHAPLGTCPTAQLGPASIVQKYHVMKLLIDSCWVPSKSLDRHMFHAAGGRLFGTCSRHG